MTGKKIDDIRKLSPEERIEMLRELEEDNKKEIEEAEKLMKESMVEIRNEEIIREIPPPGIKPVDISKLFETEEDKKPDVQQPLEETVEKEKPEVSQEQIAQYGAKLSTEPMEDIYNRMKNIYSDVNENGYMNSGQQQELASLDYAMNKKANDIEAGSYKGVSSQVSDELVASMSMAARMKDRYKGH